MNPETKLKILKDLDAGVITKNQAQALISKHSAPPDFSEERSDIGFLDRMAVKNLAESPEKGVEELKKRNPQYDFQVKDGRIFSKKQGESQYKAMDPSGFDLEDITDSGYDILAGLVETGAGIAAGVGSSFTGPGAVAVGMGAAGAAGAGMESIRQGIGSQVFDQDFSGTDVGINAGLSALGPLAFGVGGKAAKPLAKGALKSLTEKGLIGAPLSAAMRKPMAMAGELFTGVNSSIWERIGTDKKILNDYIKEGGDKVAEYSFRDLDDQMTLKMKDIGKGYKQVLKEEGDNLVDISETKTFLKGLMKDSVEQGNLTGTDADKKAAKELAGLYKEYFGRTGKGGFEEISDLVPLRKAQKMKKQLQALSDYGYKDTASAAQKKANAEISASAGLIKDQIKKTSPRIDSLDNQYMETLSDMNYVRENIFNKKSLKPSVSGPGGEDSLYKVFDKKGFRLLKRAGSDDPATQGLRDNLKTLDSKYGTNLSQTSENLSAAEIYKNAGFDPKSIGGVTSTSRTLKGELAGSAAGVLAGEQLGGGENRSIYWSLGGLGGLMATSPKAFRRYMRMTDIPSATPAYQQLKYLMRPNEEQ